MDAKLQKLMCEIEEASYTEMVYNYDAHEHEDAAAKALAEHDTAKKELAELVEKAKVLAAQVGETDIENLLDEVIEIGADRATDEWKAE